MIHSFLLIGQSNAAGRGFFAEAAPLQNQDQRLKVLRNGRWQNMYRPVNPDRPFSGTCFAERFARAYANDHDGVEVGIIPCADGGTSLNQWQVGSLLFDHAVYTAKLAMRTSHLVGILWHQGEADCSDALYPHYLEKITTIMKTLRDELNAHEIPLMVGGLGDYLVSCAKDPNLKNYFHVNQALQKFASDTPQTVYVSAEGLTSNPDFLHFSAASLEEFGLRYYNAFLTIEDKNRIFEEKPNPDNALRTEMELL